MLGSNRPYNLQELDRNLYLHACELLNPVNNALLTIKNSQSAANKAFQSLVTLESHHCLRNALFGLPALHPNPPSMSEIFQFYFGVLSPLPARIDISTQTIKLVDKSSIKKTAKNEYLRELVKSPPFIALFHQYPYLNNLGHGLSPTFLSNILGDAVLRGIKPINIHDIRYRFHIADWEARHNLAICNQHADLGKAWLKHEKGRIEAIIDIQKNVADFLKDLSKKGYLDELAGVHVTSIPTENEEEEGEEEEESLHPQPSTPEATDPHVKDGHHGLVQPNMVLKDTNDKDASSIAVWDYPLSPSFIEYITSTGLEDVLFMEDPNHQQSGRLLRVESIDVGPSKRILFQVGGDSNAVVHKARPLSSLGRMFLQIANYLSKEVHAFLKTCLELRYGADIAEKWLPRLAVYDLINHQVALKPGAQYDWHHDCKWMLCDPFIPGWEEFFLQVPTFVISNAGDGLSSINFRQREDSTRKGKKIYAIAGKRQKLAAQSLHYQLYGSNSSFQHRPEIHNPPQNYTRWVITCRETTYLQKSGFRQLSAKKKKAVTIVGNSGAYGTTLSWNSLLKPPSVPVQVAQDVIDSDDDDDDDNDDSDSPAPTTNIPTHHPPP
jgi:hypothetical protein